MKNEKLFEVKAVEGTPFAVLIKNEKAKLVIGNNIVSPDFATEKEALDWIEQKPWELLTATIGVISEGIYNQLNNK